MAVKNHIISGIMEQLEVFLSRIARQHSFFLDLVLMREVENLLVEMGDGSCILNGKSGGIMGEGTDINGMIIVAKWKITTWTRKDQLRYYDTLKLTWVQSGENMEH